MYAVGITSSELPGQLYPIAKEFEYQRTGKHYRDGRSPRYTYRYAAVLYKVHLTQEGHWIWLKTDVIAETTLDRSRAKKDVRELAWRCGDCRYYYFGLGFRRVTDEKTLLEQRKAERAQRIAELKKRKKQRRLYV